MLPLVLAHFLISTASVMQHLCLIMSDLISLVLILFMMWLFVFFIIMPWIYIMFIHNALWW